MSDKQVALRFILHILSSYRCSPSYPDLRKFFVKNELFSLWRRRLRVIYSTKMSYLSMNCQVCVIHVGVNNFSRGGRQLLKRYWGINSSCLWSPIASLMWCPVMESSLLLLRIAYRCFLPYVTYREPLFRTSNILGLSATFLSMLIGSPDYWSATPSSGYSA